MGGGEGRRGGEGREGGGRGPVIVRTFQYVLLGEREKEREREEREREGEGAGKREGQLTP